jgi:hypothetical protein
MYASASTALVRAAAEGKVLAPGDAAPAALQDPAAAAALALLQWLTSISPRIVSIAEITAWLRAHSANGPAAASTTSGASPADARTAPSIEARLPDILCQGFVAGTIDLQRERPSISVDVTDRPQTSVVARWQARGRNRVTNLRHETMTLKDPLALRLLAKLDGRLNAHQLAEAMHADAPVAATAERAREVIDAYLQQFAKHALLLQEETPRAGPG